MDWVPQATVCMMPFDKFFSFPVKEPLYPPLRRGVGLGMFSLLSGKDLLLPPASCT